MPSLPRLLPLGLPVAVAGCGLLAVTGPGASILSSHELTRLAASREGMTELTLHPFYADPGNARLCWSPPRGVTGDEAPAPHTSPRIRVYATTSSAESIVDGSDDVPVGTVVLKEKADEMEFPTGSYTGMLKRSGGYDPDCGDWEFFVVDAFDGVVERGRIAGCAECHRGFAETGYLSLAYLNRIPKD